MSSIYKIKEASTSFTSTEKRIADYCIHQREDVIQESAQKLAEATQSSPAAWIRFAQKLGYKGLTALKVDLAKDSDDHPDEFDILIEQQDTIKTMLQKAERITNQTSQQTYKLINLVHLERAIHILLQSRTIYLAGVGGSGLVCNDILQKLSRIQRDVIYHEDSHVLLARIAHIQPEDTMIAVSYSGESDDVIAAVQYAKKVGATIIAITQFNLKSTLSKLADISLYTPVQEKTLRLGAIASRNAAFILSDLLYYGVAKDNLNQTRNNIVKTRKIIQKIR